MGIKKKKVRPLTPKQLKFIAFYDGNGTDAARKAGYAGDDNVLAVMAFDNLRNPKIRRAIEQRQNKEIEPLIATRLSRQKFWTQIMNDPKSSKSDRLRASELLGKSEADFIDVVKQNSVVKTEVRIVNEKEVEESVKRFEEKYK